MKDDGQSERSGEDMSILSPIEDIIDDARNGRMFILIDEEDRENEGDLVIPAQMATPESKRKLLATRCLRISRRPENCAR